MCGPRLEHVQNMTEVCDKCGSTIKNSHAGMGGLCTFYIRVVHSTRVGSVNEFPFTYLMETMPDQQQQRGEHDELRPRPRSRGRAVPFQFQRVVRNRTVRRSRRQRCRHRHRLRRRIVRPSPLLVIRIRAIVYCDLYVYSFTHASHRTAGYGIER